MILMIGFEEEQVIFAVWKKQLHNFQVSVPELTFLIWRMQ